MASPIEIHGRVGCPFAWRVRLAAFEKGIAFRWIAFDATPPDAGAERNPERRSPWLVDGDVRLPESMVIAQYLDEAHPGRPLMPNDPRERAQSRLALLDFDKPVDGRPGASLTPEARSMLDAMFAKLESRLEGRPWLGGDEPSLADLQLWPMMTVSVVRLGYELPASLPSVRAYWDRARTRPSYVATRPPWAST